MVLTVLSDDYFLAAAALRQDEGAAERAGYVAMGITAIDDAASQVGNRQRALGLGTEDCADGGDDVVEREALHLCERYADGVGRLAIKHHRVAAELDAAQMGDGHFHALAVGLRDDQPRNGIVGTECQGQDGEKKDEGELSHN